MTIEPFHRTLTRHGLELKRETNNALQINVGLLCNQACKHCHLDAGPSRKEVMTRETMDAVIGFASGHDFDIMDITGGAPEMNPDLDFLLESLAPLTQRLMLRSNLTAIGEQGREKLMDLCRKHNVVIVASFPSTNVSQTDAQRGKGVMDKSLAALKKLNSLGYGIQGSGLELDLVSNPTGAFLPISQCKAEEKFRRDMARKWDLSFNNLYTFANVPLGRFRKWLKNSGNYDGYVQKLIDGFNPDAVDGVMCKTLISVSWDGYVYDCDFNLALDLPLGNNKTHINLLKNLPEPGTPIATGEHCYACTAGAGFT